MNPLGEVTKFNWKYIFDGGDTKKPYKIIPEPEKIVPTTLFKYYSMNDKVLETFLQGKVYGSHPDDFNDIFDCHKQLIIFDNEQIVKQFLKSVRGSLEKNGIHLSTEDSRELMWELYFKQIGILSLTEKPDNILMWSHYSKHSGFVVEFDYQKFPFIKYGPFPINYQKVIQPISIKDYVLGLCILYQTNIKSNLWEYESEWRIIIDSGSEKMKIPDHKPEYLKRLGGNERTFNYLFETIKSISLGFKFFKEFGEIRKLPKVWDIEIKDSSKESRNRLDGSVRNFV